MNPIETNYFTELIAGAVVGLGALVVGIQSILRNWKRNSAEGSLMQMMHDELERMSVQNVALSQEIGKLQNELVRLSTQLTALTAENHILQREVASLNQEISRFHRLMIGEKNDRAS
jgi:dynactin complex subunit